MRSLSGKEVCEILMKYGFVNVRQHGSHIIMQKRTATSTITIPVPNHKELKTGHSTPSSEEVDSVNLISNN